MCKDQGPSVILEKRAGHDGAGGLPEFEAHRAKGGALAEQCLALLFHHCVDSVIQITQGIAASMRSQGCLNRIFQRPHAASVPKQVVGPGK